MKNQEQDKVETKQALKDENNQVSANKSAESQIKDLVKRGRHEEFKIIIESLTKEQFEEIIQTHGYNNWNLFHYIANRGVLETLEVLNSKLADKDLAIGLCMEKDKFGRTPYNIAKYNDDNNFCRKLEEILGFSNMDKQIKQGVINSDYDDQIDLRSEKEEKTLAEKVLKEIENNKDGIPYFEDLKKAIEFDHACLINGILNKLQKSQIDKKSFFEKHGDNSYNVFHYAAGRGNPEVLKYLYNFEQDTAKELFKEKNGNNKTPYDIASDKHYSDFCSESKALGLVPYDSTESEIS